MPWQSWMPTGLVGPVRSHCPPMTISSATAGTTLPTPTTHARTRQPTNQLRSRIEPSFRLEVTGQCWPMSVGIGPQSEIPLDILPHAGESRGVGAADEDDQG